MKLIDKVTRMFRRLRALFPTRLPQGMTEFHGWASDILDLYDVPDNDSTHFALAVAILHLPSTKAYVSKEYFGRTMLKGASNEIAGATMQNLKLKQEVAKRAAQQAEATAITVVSSDEPQYQRV